MPESNKISVKIIKPNNQRTQKIRSASEAERLTKGENPNDITISYVINWIKSQKFSARIESEIIKRISKYPHNTLVNYKKIISDMKMQIIKNNQTTE